MPTLRGICTPVQTEALRNYSFPSDDYDTEKASGRFTLAVTVHVMLEKKTLSIDVLLRLKSVIHCLHNSFAVIHSLPGLYVSFVRHENRWLVSVTTRIIKSSFFVAK